MPTFSKSSRGKLNTCHDDLVKIFDEVIWIRDCTIIEGHRSEDTQNEYYRTGKSQLRFPQSKHNQFPSLAVDVMPYHPERPHLHWSDKDDMERFAKFVIETAEALYAQGKISHLIRWGADWDMDGVRVDKDPNESFFDGPHYELFKPDGDGEG